MAQAATATRTNSLESTSQHLQSPHQVRRKLFPKEEYSHLTLTNSGDEENVRENLTDMREKLIQEREQ